MAKDKKSFLLYCDLIHTVEHMPSEKAGDLFKHILKYVNDENPITDDLIVKLTFEPIKQSLKRDLLKWEDKSPQRIEKARVAGLASAEARKLKKQLNSTNELKSELNSTKSTVSVSVSVKDIDILNNNINSRKLKFANSLKIFIDEFGKEMIREFYDYWTEHGENDKKMRFEKEKSFGINRRLATWNKNNFKNKNYGKQINTTEEFKQIADAVRSDNVRR